MAVGDVATGIECGANGCRVRSLGMRLRRGSCWKYCCRHSGLRLGSRHSGGDTCNNADEMLFGKAVKKVRDSRDTGYAYQEAEMGIVCITSACSGQRPLMRVTETIMFKQGTGDWTQYRELEHSREVDFHWSELGRRDIPYEEAMAEVHKKALEALKEAQSKGFRYVLFTHGFSTSRRGNSTARSEVRKLMRSKEATPYIIRKECIQHCSAFVATIRHNLDAQGPCVRAVKGKPIA